MIFYYFYFLKAYILFKKIEVNFQFINIYFIDFKIIKHLKIIFNKFDKIAKLNIFYVILSL